MTVLSPSLRTPDVESSHRGFWRGLGQVMMNRLVLASIIVYACTINIQGFVLNPVTTSDWITALIMFGSTFTAVLSVVLVTSSFLAELAVSLWKWRFSYTCKSLIIVQILALAPFEPHLWVLRLSTLIFNLF